MSRCARDTNRAICIPRCVTCVALQGVRIWLEVKYCSFIYFCVVMASRSFGKAFYSAGCYRITLRRTVYAHYSVAG